jgi:hypothetical protein
VLKLRYPYQEELRSWQATGIARSSNSGTSLPQRISGGGGSGGGATTQQQALLFALPPELLHSAFPYHFVLDDGLVVVQAGPGLVRLLPHLQLGVTRLMDCFKVRGGWKRAWWWCRRGWV